MLFGLFITLGVAVLSVALRSYESSLSQKVGAFGILTASFLGIYYITEKLDPRPLQRAELALPALGGNPHPHPRAAFPERKNAAAEKSAVAEVFPDARRDHARKSKAKDSPTSATPAGIGRITAQFFRLFYKEEDRAQATICLNEQNDLSFYYLRISSRAQDGKIWTTWNYPLSYGLKLSPQFRINRQRPDQSFWQLYQSHKSFLQQPRGRDSHRFGG